MPIEVLLATTNPAKSYRLARILDGLSLAIVDGPSLLDFPVIEEYRGSHIGIAVQKAIIWSKRYEQIALASDGGLVIPALEAGWVSTFTHRITGKEVTDAVRARRLLSLMQHLAADQREAYWVEAIALARNGVLVCAWEAQGLRGIIGQNYHPNPNGPSGFWADGLWETMGGQKRWEITATERLEDTDPWTQLEKPIQDLLINFS